MASIRSYIFIAVTVLLIAAAGWLAAVIIGYALAGGLDRRSFYTTALPQCVALVGTSIAAFTSLAVLMGQRQAGLEVAEFNRHTGESLQRLSALADQQLDQRKRQLDTQKTAYLELFAAATVYFHTIRSLCRGNWNPDLVRTAEARAIQSARYLLYVDKATEDLWYFQWTEAQYIFDEAVRRASGGDPVAHAAQLMDQPGRDQLDFGQRYAHLQELIEAALTSQGNHPRAIV